MYQLNNYKSLDEFKSKIEFVRCYFNGYWIGVLPNKFNHEKGITKEDAKILYQERLKKEEKRDGVLGRLKQIVFHNELRLNIASDYKVVLDIMHILKKDFIDEKDFEYVLNNIENIYYTYFKNDILEEIIE